MRRRSCATLLAVLGALAAGPAPATAQAPNTYELPGNAVFPEGIAASGATFFVSSSNDGTVFRGDLSSPRASVFLPPGANGRTAALGMKVDRGRLFIAGGRTGRAFVHDAASGALLRSVATGGPAFLNDVAVTRSGDAYFTDSVRPLIFRIPARAAGTRSPAAAPLRPWLGLRGSAIRYRTGPTPNLNGIVATPDGRSLLAIQSNTGRLFRIDVATRRVGAVPVRGGRLTFGDGLLLRGRTLYVVRNRLELIVRVRLERGYSSGRVVGSSTSPSFGFPTTIATAGGACSW